MNKKKALGVGLLVLAAVACGGGPSQKKQEQKKTSAPIPLIVTPEPAHFPLFCPPAVKRHQLLNAK